MDSQQNGNSAVPQQGGSQSVNTSNMAPNQRVQQPAQNQQGGPAQAQGGQARPQPQQQPPVSLEQFKRMMPVDVQMKSHNEQLAWIKNLLASQKNRPALAANANANAGAGAGAGQAQSVSSDVATQGSPQLPQQAGPNVPPVPVNMQANNGIVQGSGAHGRPPQVPQQQVPPEVVAKLLANARQNPSAMNSLTQMIAAQGGHAGFPAGTTAAQQRDALMRFAQQARGGQQGQGGPAAAAQLVAQTQRMMQAQQQQALGNGGSPVQAQPNQNGNLPGPRPAQQGVQSQPLQVQASGQNNNTGNINTVNNNNQGANQANGNAAAGRAPPPGPIAMPPQAGQARPSGPGAVPLPTQVNTAQRPNLNKQALDQQLTNILSNLDFFIQKKENNQLTMDETKMLNLVLASKGPGFISQQQQQQQQQANQQQQQQQQQQQTNQQQQQQQIQANLARQFQQARANSQNGNAAQGGVHTGAHLAAFRQLQNAQAAQGQPANMVLAPQNIGMMNMNQAAFAANMGQGAQGQNGGPSTPGQQARVQQALAMQAGNAQGGPGLQTGMSPHNMGSPNSVSGSNLPGNPTVNLAYERIDNLDEEKRNTVFEKNPSIRKSYLRHLSQQSQDKRAALFANDAALGEMYEQHVADEQNMQGQLQQRAGQGQDATAQPVPVSQQPGGAMNLQLPAGRQRAQAPGTGNVQGPNRVGPPGQSSTGMNLQPNAALQAQMNAAQQAVLASQLQAQNQLAQQREMAAASSPASMHGTPILQHDGLPGARGGTPGRVGSLQGGRPVRGSPNVANATTVPMPNQANSQMAQQRMQAGLQAQLQLAQVANNARAQLQANYHSQNQNLNTSQAGLVPNLHGVPTGIPLGVPANMPPGPPHPNQLPPNVPSFVPQPVIITPTDIRSLIIPDILTETAWSAPKPAKFLDFVRPSRLSLSNGLGANHSMAMPVYSARPPALDQLSATLKNKSGRAAALKGTLFDKAFSADPEDEKEEQKADERAALEAADDDDDEARSEIGKRSPGQMSVDEVEEETTIHPRVKRRKLGDVAKLAKRDLTISEGSEEFLLQLCDEFIESALETSCRLAKHRKSNKLEIKDMQFLLAHNYDVQLPGYASDAIRIEQNKADLKAIASSIPPSRASRLNAVQQAKSGAKVRG